MRRIVNSTRTEQRAADGSVVQVSVNSYGKAFYEREFDRAFVLMQYFGYPRRDPDEAGCQSWCACARLSARLKYRVLCGVMPHGFYDSHSSD